MTYTPIARGTQLWDTPLNTALTQLDNSIATVASDALQVANNLSDLSNVPVARSNLGLSSSATTTGSSFNVKDYGALGNGVADDTAAVQSAINACSSAGGGEVFFPTGTYLLTPTTSPAITVPSYVRLAGSDRRATTLKKNAAGVLISMSGPSTDTTGATHVKYSGIENLEINGNSLTGLLLELYYADNLYFSNMYTYGNWDICVDTTEFWDSRFINCTWEASGGQTANASMPNVYLRNSAAASGFGYSGDNVNQIHFIGCRWEAFYTGALWLTQGVAATNNPNGIYITDCKMESSDVNGGPFFKADSSCAHIVVNGVYCYSGGFFPGYSTAQTVINFAAAKSSLSDIFIGSGSSATVRIGVDLFVASNNYTALTSVYGGYTTAPTGSHVYYEPSSVGTPSLRNVRTNTGTLFGGHWPATTNPTNKVASQNSTDIVQATAVTGDSVDRHTVDASGKSSWGSGTAAADISLGRGAANRLDLLTSNFAINTVGYGLEIAEGSNAKMGTATLASGSATVSTTAVTSNSRIYLTAQNSSGTPGFLHVGTITAGTSFTIVSSSNTDTSTVAWMIVDHT